MKTKYYRVKKDKVVLSGVQHQGTPYWSTKNWGASETTYIIEAQQWADTNGGTVELIAD